jgi:tetratricopeptide (TPR) repeat protein
LRRNVAAIWLEVRGVVSDELAGLLAAGERAAFHGRPAGGVPPLEQAVATARASGRDDEATAAAWLLGVALGAAGKYGSALAVLEPLTLSGPVEPALRLFASLAASTAASLHRQLGRHAGARVLDEHALTLAGDAPEALFDARLGLAADAVGLEDSAEARAWLDQAGEVLDGRADWWRQRVRNLWVRTEVGMLTGDTASAEKTAESAVSLAEASGAPRHVAKSLLFLGVSQVQNGGPDDAILTLRRAATLAESLGCLPLVWPSRALLGAMLEAESRAESAQSLAGARSTVIAIADDLPEDLRADWLARPDISALLEG